MARKNGTLEHSISLAQSRFDLLKKQAETRSEEMLNGGRQAPRVCFMTVFSDTNAGFTMFGYMKELVVLELDPRSEQGSVWHGCGYIRDRNLEVLAEDEALKFKNV